MGDEEAEQSFGLLQEIIVRIRDARNQMNVEPARRIPVIMAVGKSVAMFEQQAPLIEFLARTQNPDGSWNGVPIGQVYTACCYLTILQLDNGVLPIYQR